MRVIVLAIINGKLEMVSKGSGKGMEELEIGGQIETI